MNKENTPRDMLAVIVMSRKMLVAFFVVAILLAVLLFFITPKAYTATTTILPVAGANTGMADFLSGTSLAMLANSETKANVILVALESQSLAEEVVTKNKLAGLILGRSGGQISEDYNLKAAALLNSRVMSVFVTRNGAIEISATLANQDKVADLANSYVDELSVFLNKRAINMNYVVIDRAHRPEKASSPDLMLNLFKSLAIAFFFSLFYLGFVFACSRQK